MSRGLAVAVVVIVLSACSPTSQARVPGATDTSAPTPSVRTTPGAVVSAALWVTPSVANNALAARARETGRSDVALCLYVDPSTGLDAGAALRSMQNSVDSLVGLGYTVLAARPVAPCPQPPVFIRTNTVHAKNSGGGGEVGSALNVSTPSPYQLFAVLTTEVRIKTIFGGFSSHRGSEEMQCAGDHCGTITESIYTDPLTFARAADLENVILEGLGLLQVP